MQRKKTFAWLMSLCLLFSVLAMPAAAAKPETTGSSAKFGDVDQSAWYVPYIDYVVDHGLMAGMSSDTFEPNTTVTRAQLVQTLYALAGKPKIDASSDFTDLTAGWYKNAVNWADRNGVVAGYGKSPDRTFRPDQEVTRQQTAVIFSAYARNIDGQEANQASDLSGYKDASDISDYAVSAMKWAVAVGLMDSRSSSEKVLVPKGVLTRAELAVMLYKYTKDIVPQQTEPAESKTPAEPSESAAQTVATESNAVYLVGGSGVTVNSGSYTTSDVCFSDSQDPNGENTAGHSYTLKDRKFTFNLNRESSSETADWFNALVSGYNDPGITGDRTTFDETADKLDFAFLGDLVLNITTEDYPSGEDVTFKDVAMAQETTTSMTTRWWFGQKTGQHTKDSDGADTVLLTGEDSSGNTVYASFLSGNLTNFVYLSSAVKVETARTTANTVSNVQETFAKLKTYGTVKSLLGFPGSYDPTYNHIQGYALYDDADGQRYSVITHSVETASYAHIVAGTTSGIKKTGYKTYLNGWQHPGGIAILGDYLVVPNEEESSSHVNLYDLRSLGTEELRRVENFDMALDHKAGAVGITSYEDANGKTWYVLVVAHLHGSKSDYYIFRASADNGLENAEFEQLGCTRISKDFQGFGLVTETGTNDIYMIGLYSPETDSGAQFEDYACLYQLDTKNWSFGEELDSIQMTSLGGAPLLLGVHFRYGAGTFVTSDGTLILSATERNSVLGSPLTTNSWTVK